MLIEPGGGLEGPPGADAKLGNAWPRPSGDFLEPSRSEAPLRLLAEYSAAAPGSWHPLVLDEDRRCFSLHWPQAISAEKSQDFFLKLLSVAPWVELLNTKGTSVTRSTCWFSSGGCTCDYAYGRETRVTNADVMNAADGRAQVEDMTGSDQFIHGSVEAEPLSDESLSGFKAAMEEIMQHVFGDLFPGLEKEAWPNSANINLYRDGRQGVGWHADDESLFCGKDSDCPVVSISLGATREFWIALKTGAVRWGISTGNVDQTSAAGLYQPIPPPATSEALYVSLEDAVIEEPLEEPHVSQLASVFQSLVGNGMGVIPTDTQHAYVTPVNSKSGVRRIYDIKGVAADQRKPLSLLCSDLSMASKYCDVAALPRKWFQNMKACLPGPYTFILRASGEVPRIVMDHKSRSKVWKRREVGIRVPNNSIVWQLVEEETLLNFLESKGLTGFHMDMPFFPDGKSRGYAVMRFRKDSFAAKESIRSIEGQFVPGFQKRAPLRLEPLRGKGPRRCIQSQNFMTETPLPLPRGPCHYESTAQAEASAGAGVNSEPGSQIATSCSLADGMETAVALPGEMAAPHEANINTTQDLEAPLLASSAPDSAVEIWTEQKNKLDFVVGAEAIVEMWAGMEKEDRVSTVVDLTMEEPVLRRQGLGDVSMFDDMVDAAMFE
ncbi:hypothetical protein AK812_SmicGene16455 [Symbiodinium microadriaticum]|uniref:Threonylcarbamoyl-AMP synthase n=1 Tax=Symbiodinium microadriaticum TaxID=2951 RepID=A0A1Q9E0E3_SYMMI|nr:hypothetical protein AK812_SmicGene16455 [Symbiodinium microadriaticum]